jgi:hypothetical protein
MSFIVGQLVRCEDADWHINEISVCGPERGQIYMVVGVYQEQDGEILEFPIFRNTYPSDCFCSIECAKQLDAMANMALHPRPPGLSLDIFLDFELRPELIDEVDLVDWNRHIGEAP